MKISKNQKWKNTILVLGSVLTIAPFSLIAAACSDRMTNNVTSDEDEDIEEKEKKVARNDLKEAINEISSKWLRLNFSNIKKLNAQKEEVIKTIDAANALLESDETTTEQLKASLDELNKMNEKLEDVSYPEIEAKILELDKFTNELNGILTGLEILEETNSSPATSSNEAPEEGKEKEEEKKASTNEKKEEKDKSSNNEKSEDKGKESSDKQSSKNESSEPEALQAWTLENTNEKELFKKVIEAFNAKVTNLKAGDEARLANEQVNNLINESKELFQKLSIIQANLTNIKKFKKEVDTFSESQKTNYWDLIQYLSVLSFDLSDLSSEGIEKLKDLTQKALANIEYIKLLNEKLWEIEINRDYLGQYYAELNKAETTTSSDQNDANAKKTTEEEKKAWKEFLDKFDELYAKYNDNLDYVIELQKGISEAADSVRFGNYLSLVIPKLDEMYKAIESSEWIKVAENKTKFDEIKTKLNKGKEELKNVNTKDSQGVASSDRKALISFGRWVKTTLEALEFEIKTYDEEHKKVSGNTQPESKPATSGSTDTSKPSGSNTGAQGGGAGTTPAKPAESKPTTTTTGS